MKPHIRKVHGWWTSRLRGKTVGISPRDMLAAQRFCDKLNGVRGGCK